MRIIEIFNKHKEKALYIFFGGLTTLVNLAVFFVFSAWLHADTVVSNSAAWFLSVVFAFVVNKLYVFESKTKSLRALLIELTLFVAARVFSGAIDTALVWIFIDVLAFNSLAVKILSNVIVILLNYVFSKRIIFKSS